MKRTIFIGDVHGCYEELTQLLQKLCKHFQVSSLPALQAHVIFLGDLIGKGPHSAQVVQYVHEHHYTSLLGNHELRYLHFLKKLPSPTTNSLEKFPPYYERLNKMLGQKLNHFIHSFPLFIEEEDFIAVHGGLHPHLPVEECSAEFLTNIRKLDGIPWHHHYRGPKPVLYGHWGQQGLNIRTHSIGLDSGCVYGGKLSAYILETQTLLQVSAQRTYVPIHR